MPARKLSFNPEHVGTESTSVHLTFSDFGAMLNKAAARNDDPEQDLVLWLTERCDAEPKLRRAVQALVDSILSDVKASPRLTGRT